MKDEHYAAFAFNREQLEGGIRTAVATWLVDRAAAKLQYGPIASWDTSEVTSMNSLFRPLVAGEVTAGYNAAIARFNGDLSRWDVGQVTNMGDMFYGATSFNGDLSSWDVGQVTDMDWMFMGATSFNRQLGGSWSASTASQVQMFNRSGGSIA